MFLVGDQTLEILQAFPSPEITTWHYADRHLLCRDLVARIGPGDRVFFKGSRGTARGDCTVFDGAFGRDLQEKGVRAALSCFIFA